MLNIGDKLPQIELPDHDGNTFTFDQVSGRPLVVYFYPKNNTPGCTVEACSFRDRYDDFLKVGAEVIGISGDSSDSHAKVKEKRNLPFILLSDVNRVAEKAFGVPRNLFGMLPGRVTFVVNDQGTIIHTYNSATNPTQHIVKALAALKEQK